MTLYVENTENDKITAWHVGGEKLGDIVRGQFVVSVQADGDELDLINDTIEGIPKNRKQRCVRWSGENACFIVENL